MKDGAYIQMCAHPSQKLQNQRVEPLTGTCIYIKFEAYTGIIICFESFCIEVFCIRKVRSKYAVKGRIEASPNPHQCMDPW